MTICEATECVFEYPNGWIDDTGYQYDAGEVNVVAGPFATRDTWQRKVDEALEKFRLSVAGYELVERRRIDLPTPSAEIVVLRVGGTTDVFELSIFWPIGEVVWVFRSRGPQSFEVFCRETAQRFLQTYEPVPRLEEA